ADSDLGVHDRLAVRAGVPGLLLRSEGLLVELDRLGGAAHRQVRGDGVEPVRNPFDVCHQLSPLMSGAAGVRRARCQRGAPERPGVALSRTVLPYPAGIGKVSCGMFTLSPIGTGGRTLQKLSGIRARAAFRRLPKSSETSEVCPGGRAVRPDGLQGLSRVRM